MSRFPRAFAERNRVVIAVVGLLVLGVSFYAAMNMTSLPVVGEGRVHQAIFAEGGGLRPGDEVRVAGVRVGEVTDVRLEGDQVRVYFRAKDVELPSATTASIEVKTMLGQKYLAVDPLGEGTLEGAIPLERTTTPYDVNAAISDFSTELNEIDTVQLEESFDALATAFEDTPKSVQKMVGGLTDLSRTISSRDSELAELLDATQGVTGTLADRNDELAALFQDGSALLGELQHRREALHSMWLGARDLGTQVRGLVEDNDRTLAPALAKLDRVSALLNRNQKNLDDALGKLGPYYRVLASATGNGPWADAYLCGLFDQLGLPELRNDVVRDCKPGGSQ
ncbi:MCE family protein [Nocardioides lianchengensis]|uniref:Phospholipid/cholesterol/gamma-HCH transport system substrate-binding protein n=1 Tax=Nocardioides lianchengensis TaxID=1045774 RepID=A0A1G7B8B8_9ACTN|nr:MCE family protein [Nocardioides lianchengensis]NYG10101.1 phospholipid/cholesterol/gamma-HCH transport system substrate-binding protein [Nocardioides lianchengensis]SDE22556.1 phospholipid/cholesterol/gamma-HCH transport system substrate-binding protein [Nocardioides lianchengensis]